MNLHLDWASYTAAKYACENWHYSECMPSGKLVKIGVWEDEKFVGVIIFGLGATPNLCKPYGLNQQQCCELVRIALKKHQSPVSRIMAISIKILKNFCPGLKLIVSFADANRSHHGGIYQAANWIYAGMTNGDIFYKKDGKLHHGRSLVAKYGSRKSEDAIKRGFEIVYPLGKHRYLMPLTSEISDRIKKLSKPYPKRVGSKENVAAGFQSAEGGANPTPTLQKEIVLAQKDAPNGE